jgi:hypothetical protein
MANLYELSAGYVSLIDAYDAAETDEEREDILKLLAEAEGDIADKGEAYAKVIRMKEEEAKAFKAEADRLTKKRQAAENMVSRLKSAMLDSMKLTGQTEIKTSIGKWRLQMNPWSCEVVDADKVPMQYHIKQEDKIDKVTLLKQFALTGEMVDGCEFIQKQGIRFR